MPEISDEELERLRFADEVMGSETMVWLLNGSENWTQTHIQNMRKMVNRWYELGGKAWWKKHQTKDTPQ